jgi:beta-lactamase class A
MKEIILSIIFLTSISICYSQKTNKQLQLKVEETIKGFNGEIGVYIKNLKTGKIVAINADTVFPTASIVKIPILLGIMNKLQNGELSYHQQFIYKDSLLYEGEDILGSFKNNESIQLAKLLMLMLTTSDNTASLWLQSIAGTGTRINTILDSLGFVATRINSRTTGREELRNIYGWGQTSPREMAMLLEKIYHKEIFSDSICIQMMRLLGRNYWDEEGLSQIPPTIEVFSKNGAVNASRSEVMLVNAPHNPYLFCIITKNNKDQSWSSSNEAWMLTKKLSAMLWNYFEPGMKYISE